MSDPWDTLQKLREAAGLSQAELATKAGGGLNQARVSLIERGERPSTSLDTVRRILKALGQPWAALDGYGAAAVRRGRKGGKARVQSKGWGRSGDRAWIADPGSAAQRDLV